MTEEGRINGTVAHAVRDNCGNLTAGISCGLCQNMEARAGSVVDAYEHRQRLARHSPATV